MSPGLPIFLLPTGARALVIGGGEVALRKVEWLLSCGIPVEVVSPLLHPGLTALAAAKGTQILLRQTAYTSEPLHDYLVVIAATDQAEVNARVYADACSAGIPVNVVDDPERCTFFVPATLTRGDLQIAVGTGGASPSLAGRIRRELETLYPEAYSEYTAALAELRRWAREEESDPELRRRALSSLATTETFNRLQGMNRVAMLREMKQRFPQATLPADYQEDHK